MLHERCVVAKAKRGMGMHMKTQERVLVLVAAVLLTGAALAGVTPPVSAPLSPTFAEVDRNQSGYVERDETARTDGGPFVLADADKNGRLDPAEFSLFLESAAAALKNQDDMSKEILLHLVVVGKLPFSAGDVGLID